ncbi:hypothetical protein Csa_023773, partial [Cucumis sativus]
MLKSLNAHPQYFWLAISIQPQEISCGRYTLCYTLMYVIY